MNYKPNTQNNPAYGANRPEPEFEDKVIEIKRVSKKTKGGNQISFTALVVSGDKKSRVGVGLGKAKSVADAIQKGIKRAHKSMVTIETVNGQSKVSYPYNTKRYHFFIILEGKVGGLKAGGAVRAVVDWPVLRILLAKLSAPKINPLMFGPHFKLLRRLKIPSNF